MAKARGPSKQGMEFPGSHAGTAQRQDRRQADHGRCHLCCRKGQAPRLARLKLGELDWMVLKLKAFTIHAPVLLVISVGGLNSNACVLGGKGRRWRRTEFPVPARKRRSAWCLRMTAKGRFDPLAKPSTNDCGLRV